MHIQISLQTCTELLVEFFQYYVPTVLSEHVYLDKAIPFWSLTAANYTYGSMLSWCKLPEESHKQPFLHLSYLEFM